MIPGGVAGRERDAALAAANARSCLCCSSIARLRFASPVLSTNSPDGLSKEYPLSSRVKYAIKS